MKAYQVIVRENNEIKGKVYTVYALSEQLACIGARVKQVEGECIQSLVDQYKQRITSAYIAQYQKQVNMRTLETIPMCFIQAFFLDQDHCFILMPQEITLSKNRLLA